MKRVIVLLMVICLTSSLFAVANWGVYTIDEVKNSTAASFFNYLKANDYLEKFKGYGFFCDDDEWQLYLVDKNDAELRITFKSMSLDFTMWLGEVDISTKSEYTVLSAINQAAIDFGNFGAVYCYFPTKTMLYGIRMSNVGITNKFLYDEVDWLFEVRRKVVDELKANL